MQEQFVDVDQQKLMRTVSFNVFAKSVSLPHGYKRRFTRFSPNTPVAMECFSPWLAKLFKRVFEKKVLVHSHVRGFARNRSRWLGVDLQDINMS